MQSQVSNYWREFLKAAQYELAAAYLEGLEGRLARAVPECRWLSRAARYLIEAGGRRIRPLVALGMCEALGGSWQHALPGAVAVELIHTASLIHDDLVDGSERRRGRPAVHVRFDTSVAILTGDMLCFAAFGACEPLAGASGILSGACTSMCRGEVTEDPVESARLKSGSLFGAAARLGAVAARAEEEALRAAGRYGEKLGTAYQLRDNQLDGEGEAAPGPFGREAASALDRLPASRPRELLLELCRFASQRTR